MSGVDVVTQLRKFAAIQPEGNGPSHLANSAAAEIERLREASNRWKHVAALFGEAFAIDEFGQYVPSDGSDVFRAVLAYEQAKREEARRD